MISTSQVRDPLVKLVDLCLQPPKLFKYIIEIELMQVSIWIFVYRYSHVSTSLIKQYTKLIQEHVRDVFVKVPCVNVEL